LLVKITCRCHCNKLRIRRLPRPTTVPPPIFMTQTTVCHSQPDTYPSYTHPRALGASAPLASAMSWCLSKGKQFATCKAGSPAPASD
jgi:hypothetical protein